MPFIRLPADDSLNVTTSTKPTSVTPLPSCAATTGCCVRTAPLTAPAGCVTNTSRSATTSAVSAFALTDGRSVPTPSWSLATSTNDSPSALAVYATPENVATPDTAVAVPFTRLPADDSLSVTTSAKSTSTFP